MAIVVAQSSALKKGNSVQRLPAINAAMMRMIRNVRVRSGGRVCSVIALTALKASRTIFRGP